ncbi:MAG: helix-turn-helix transcriptional regulator [Lachnospiraceae bacterium]|nr:helix-turn-helix transcriptional regulator [Lachnospiraceae bacterium]
MSENTIVKKIVEYIENHLNEDLSLDKIAKALNYSKYYIARVFTEETECTIYKYIQGRRLTLAAQELVETKKPIIEIAYEAHYNSQQAFTLAFHQLYLCTPQTYRKNAVFYPKQTRISMNNSVCHFSYTNYVWGGRIAA